MGHTPTPRKLINGHAPTPFEAHGKRGLIKCVAEGGWTIAEVFSDDDQYASGEHDANVAFIVRACNAHNELVAALRLAGPALTLALAGLDSEDSDTTSIGQARDAIRAALAKVQPQAEAACSAR